MTMIRSLALLLPLIAAAAYSAEPPPRIFPDDYTTAPCAPVNSCRSFDRDRMSRAAFTFMGLHLDQTWVEAHAAELEKLAEPTCRKHATCLATLSNNFLFCDDVVTPEFREVCDKRFPRAASEDEWQQCNRFMETFALGIDQKAEELWLRARECANVKNPPTERTKAPLVWVDPAIIPPGYRGSVTIYAIDADTHVPLQANISITGQILYAPSNPAGNLQAYYPFKWPTHYTRVPNAAGHSDLVPPEVVVTAEHYPDVKFPLPVVVPSLELELIPPAKQLHSGKNVITVSARDAKTKKPVEMRVMLGDRAIGTSNEPIELELPRKGKRPEIWVTSLFDRYSDATVVPAQK